MTDPTTPRSDADCPDPKCLYCHVTDEAHMAAHASAHHIFTGRTPAPIEEQDELMEILEDLARTHPKGSLLDLDLRYAHAAISKYVLEIIGEDEPLMEETEFMPNRAIKTRNALRAEQRRKLQSEHLNGEQT